MPGVRCLDFENPKRGSISHTLKLSLFWKKYYFFQIQKLYKFANMHIWVQINLGKNHLLKMDPSRSFEGQKTVPF